MPLSGSLRNKPVEWKSPYFCGRFFSCMGTAICDYKRRGVLNLSIGSD